MGYVTAALACSSSKQVEQLRWSRWSGSKRFCSTAPPAPPPYKKGKVEQVERAVSRARIPPTPGGTTIGRRLRLVRHGARLSPKHTPGMGV